MRLVAVSMVKNEADVVEAFVRHTAAVVDHHLVFDHRSTDGTQFVLRRLRKQGLPVTGFHDDRVEYLQSERTTDLMRRAVRDFGADWVLPLDADEFVQAADPAAVRRALEERHVANRPVSVLLHDLAAHPTDDPAEPNPVVRLRHRPAYPPHTRKVFVPAPLAAAPRATLAIGNHTLHGVEAADLPGVWLAHVPARTGGQAVVKAVTGELQRLAGGAATKDVFNHYRYHVGRLLDQPALTLADPGRYLAGTAFAPAAYWGGPLSPPLVPLADADRALLCLVPFLEHLARGHGRLRDRLAEPTTWLARLRALFRGVPPAEPVALRDGFWLPGHTDAVPLRAEVTVTDPRPASLAATVRNVGPCVWRHGGADAVRLGVQTWRGDTLVNRDYRRVSLPADVEPGEAVTLTATVPAPPTGERLRLDLVAEGLRWFDRPTDV